MNVRELRRRVESLASGSAPSPKAARDVLESLLTALESGEVRAAEPATGGGWQAQRWVKEGILLGFRIGENRTSSVPPAFYFRDRDTFPTLDPARSQRDVRIVPGGSSVRRGAYLGDGVVMMPPSYVNVGAYVGAGSMVDSHALVGSCAQIGRRVHLSAAAQIGGVLEPVGALPVIIEDDVFVGGGSGVYEGTRVGAGAVLAPGVILSGALSLIDLVRQTVHRASGEQPLMVPERAVVVPGSRPASGSFAIEHGIQLQAPVIVKYRDAGTDAALVLEEALR